MKLLALLLTALLAFSATACQKETPPDTSMEFNPETDCQYYNSKSGVYPIAESPDGYYYITNVENPGFIRYIDKESLQDTILCGKPNCLHAKEDDITQCNGYIGTGRWMSIHYYNGSIYTISKVQDPKTFGWIHQFTKISLDGSVRKAVWNLDWEHKEQFPYLHQELMHRGKLYFSVYTSVTNEKEPMELYCYDLRSKKCIPILTETQGIDLIAARGDYLYYTAYNTKREYSHVYRYTLSTGEITELSAYQNVFFYSDKILFRTKEDATKYIQTDLDGETEKEYGLSFASFYGANENYICISRSKFFRKETGQEVTYEDYLEATTFDTTGMTQEEIFLELDKRHVKFDIVYDKENTIYDVETLEELGKITVPSGMNVVYFEGDRFVVFEATFGTFQTIDFSKLGTNEFQWVTSSKVN